MIRSSALKQSARMVTVTAMAGEKYLAATASLRSATIRFSKKERSVCSLIFAEMSTSN
jgi:hypothetical protein|tara:strand:+ start:1496 stop:1669 length:174 start_codon:yes stop_codon:yes gene_type:complete